MRGRPTCLILLPLLALLFPAPGAFAQGNAQLKVDGNRIKSYIQHLSTDEMMGRQSMTPHYQEAAEWVAAQYEAWGLEPAGDNGTYFQRVPIGRGVSWTSGVPSVSINGAPLSIVEGDFSINAVSTPATTVDADVVFVGYGISAPAKGLDEYAATDVRGKIVLALTGSPMDAPRAGGGGSMAPAPRPEPEPQEAWTEESTEIAKLRTAFEKGAAAILLYNPDAATQTAMRPGGRGAPQESFIPTRDFLAFTISDRTFRTIMKPDVQESVRGFTTRLNDIRNEVKYGRPQTMATGATARLKGYDSVTEYSEEMGNNYANNVLAKLPGAHPNLRDQFVVMGGHLDHLGVRDGQVYNGADDNASGPAVAMEVARVLSEGGFRPRRTIIFAAWCGEELGLIGSNHFVANPPQGIDIENVVTYFNMDMVGLGDAIGAPGALNFPTIWEVIRRGQDADVIAAVRPSTGSPGGSDYSAFISRGIEALGLMTSGGVGHPYYHRPEDDTGMIDPEILRKTGQFVLQGTMNVAQETEVDLLIQDRQNLYNALQFSISSFTPGQGDYERVLLDARSKEALVGLVMDSALAVNTRLREQAQQSASAMPAMRYGRQSGGGMKTFTRGVSDLSLFEGDAALLMAAAEFVGFGRLDVEGDDGQWFSGGHLTAEGRRALQLFEANDIWIHLANPSPTLFEEMLAAASRPFIVTGDYTLSTSMVDQINAKGVVLGVRMDPADVGQAIDDLEALKRQLGDADNLTLCLTRDDGLEEAETALYMGLLERGWNHMEIVGDRRAGGGIGGGNLRAFTAGNARGFMR